MNENLLDVTWVPESCTLPTTEQPLRVATFDNLVAQDALAVRTVDDGRLAFDLRHDPDVAGRAAPSPPKSRRAVRSSPSTWRSATHP